MELQTAEAPAALPAEQCPKCGKTLVDPAGLGWCPGCGYCKSLANDQSERLLAQKKSASLGGVVEAGGAIAGLPAWFWACLLFMGVGIGFSIYNATRLPAGPTFPRAIWATAQMAVGFLMMFVGQVWALFLIAPDEMTLTFKDAVFPFRLWSLVFKRLPQCKECLWIGVLGLSLAVGSPVFIGGFGHWFEYLPKSAVEQAKEKERQRLSAGGGAVVVPVD